MQCTLQGKFPADAADTADSRGLSVSIRRIRNNPLGISLTGLSNPLP
jgi:hypothetical protein